jgi:hypothetical protein
MTNIDTYNKYNETTYNFAIQHSDYYNLTADFPESLPAWQAFERDHGQGV